MSRARFCVSAGHTMEDIDKALAVIDEVADLLWLRTKRNIFGAGDYASRARLTASGAARASRLI